jgi:hypothetical protein
MDAVCAAVASGTAPTSEWCNSARKLPSCPVLNGFHSILLEIDGSLRPYSRFSIPEPLLFLSSSSSVVLTRLCVPRSRPTTSQKMW